MATKQINMHREFEALEELRDAIKCFWYDRRDAGSEQSAFEVIPDGYAEIIFHFGGDCSTKDGKGLQLLPSPFMVGLLNKPAIYYSKNKLEIIAIRCYPWTVFDLLGLQSGKGAIHTFEHPIAKLHPLLAKCIKAGKIEEAVAHVQHYFLKARKKVAVDTMLFKAGAAMQKANGSMPVSQVAESAHATVRTLERKFKKSSGHTVKDVSGLMRFEQVRNQLWHKPDANLAALAYDFGYTDQAHLSKEFKRYSGNTLAAFARNARKRQLGAAGSFVAFIQA